MADATVDIGGQQVINVHHLSNKPDECYAYEFQNGTFDDISVIHDDDSKLEKTVDSVRFVCISDTHNKTKELENMIPNGDILLHTGDFTLLSSEHEIREFNKFLQMMSQTFKYIVVIAGNHEISFDSSTWDRKGLLMSLIKLYFLHSPFSSNLNPENSRSILQNCYYLQDEAIELMGIKIYGSPWQPPHFNLAFNVERGEKILEKWNKIPGDTDILMTHGPPLGIGDKVKGKIHVGCSELLSTIKKRVHPKYHIFGHIHEDPGMWTDGSTTFINASSCDRHYKAIQKPLVFDYKLYK